MYKSASMVFLCDVIDPITMNVSIVWWWSDELWPADWYDDDIYVFVITLYDLYHYMCVRTVCSSRLSLVKSVHHLMNKLVNLIEHRHSSPWTNQWYCIVQNVTWIIFWCRFCLICFMFMQLCHQTIGRSIVKHSQTAVSHVVFPWQTLCPSINSYFPSVKHIWQDVFHLRILCLSDVWHWAWRVHPYF